MVVTHQKVSTVPDGADTDKVRPSDWNADHDVDIAHGDLTGVSANQHHAQAHAVNGADHTGTLDDSQIPATIARDTEVATAVSDHEAAANPHPTYETSAEAQAKVDVHTGDGTDAHDASAVSVVPAGSIAATDVQAALEEVATEYAAADSAHAAAGDPHPAYELEADHTAAAHNALGLSHDALADVSANDHHAQAHVINGADHSGTLDDAQIPAGIARDAEVATAVSDHAAAADPHAVYLKETDFDDVDFLVGTATGHTGAEIVVGTTPGGELGGTWAAPTVDATHSGSTHAAAQAAAEATAQAALDAHTGDAADAHDASAISIVDAAGDFDATDVEGALAELQADAEAHVAAADPHGGYRLESADHTHASTGLQAGQLDHGTALTGLSDDDHPQYQKESEKAVANGYASLGADTLVPQDQLGSGAQDGTKFLRDDGTWAAPTASVAFTTAEVSLGAAPNARRSGRFTITGAGLTIGKPVMIQQASGPYTGKGTRSDEAEMDLIVVTGKVLDATTIECFWNSQYRVRGNFKFDYLIGA